MGWKMFCPGCKQEKDTTCCACGCGNCLTCGWLFSCLPPPDLSEQNYIMLNGDIQIFQRSEMLLPEYVI